MISTTNQSFEEFCLLNPCFCGMLLWQAVVGYSEKLAANTEMGMRFELAYLVLPLILHQETREALPRQRRSSLPVWLDEYPLFRGQIAGRARALAPFTRNALLLAAKHKVLIFNVGAAGGAGHLLAVMSHAKKITRVINACSSEVRACASRARFVGGWLSVTGDTTTTLALFGVRP